MEKIPSGIYWSREGGNFYDAETNKGMGIQFYDRWKDRKSEFPDRATTPPGIDLYFDKTATLR